RVHRRPARHASVRSHAEDLAHRRDRREEPRRGRDHRRRDRVRRDHLHDGEREDRLRRRGLEDGAGLETGQGAQARAGDAHDARLAADGAEAFVELKGARVRRVDGPLERSAAEANRLRRHRGHEGMADGAHERAASLGSRPWAVSDCDGKSEKWLWTASHFPLRRSSTKVPRPGRVTGRPSGPVTSVSQPPAIHALSPDACTLVSPSKWKLRMRGQTFCHCSRTMLSRPATARAQVPKAIASVANSSRPTAKSRARTAASNVRSQSWGVATEGPMAALCNGNMACCWSCPYPGAPCECCTPPTSTSRATATETRASKPPIKRGAGVSSSASSIARCTTTSIWC